MWLKVNRISLHVYIYENQNSICPPWHWSGMQERKSDPRSRASAPGWFVASPYYCWLDCLLARLSNLRCQLLCSSVSKLSWQDNTSYVEIICMSLLLNASLHNNTSDKEVYYRVFGLGAWKRLSHTQIHTEAVTNTQTHRHTDTHRHTHTTRLKLSFAELHTVHLLNWSLEWGCDNDNNDGDDCAGGVVTLLASGKMSGL